MAEGTSTFMGLAVPLYGESEIQQTTLATDIVTLTGVASQTGDFFVCQSSTGTESFVVDVNGRIAKMAAGSVALASLASNASASVALVGITTACAVTIFPRAATTTASIPVVWVNAADKLGYGAGGVQCDAVTVNYWYFATA